MDLGSGTVVFSSGVVAGRPHRVDGTHRGNLIDRKRPRRMTSGGNVAVLVVIGAARAIAVSGVGYAVHVSE